MNDKFFFGIKGYYATKEGEIYSERKGIFLKKGNCNEYSYVCLMNGNKSKTMRVCRIIAKLFVENPENKPQVNHIDGVKSNDDYKNLEWCTNQENSRHAWDNGLCRIAKSIDGWTKPVIDISNGKVYKSITVTASENNIKRSTLSAMITGQNKNKTNFRYYEI